MVFFLSSCPKPSAPLPRRTQRVWCVAQRCVSLCSRALYGLRDSCAILLNRLVCYIVKSVPTHLAVCKCFWLGRTEAELNVLSSYARPWVCIEWLTHWCGKEQTHSRREPKLCRRWKRVSTKKIGLSYKKGHSYGIGKLSNPESIIIENSNDFNISFFIFGTGAFSRLKAWAFHTSTR